MRNIIIKTDTYRQDYNYRECMQNDDIQLEVTLFENGVPLDLSDCSISVNWNKADNTIVSIAGSLISFVNNVVSVVLPRDCTRAIGEVRFELVVTKGSMQTTTFPLSIKVIGSVVQGQSVSDNVANMVEELNTANVRAELNIEEINTSIANGNIGNMRSDLDKTMSQLDEMAFNLNTFAGATDQLKLSNAINFFNGSNGTLLIAKNYNLTANITVPKNITLKFTQSGTFTLKPFAPITINGNIGAGIHQIFICTAGDVLLPNLKQEIYLEWFGAKGDGVTNDQVAINSCVWSQAPVIRVTKGVWVGYWSNGFSNRTFIFDEGSIIDGVVHVATGKGQGVDGYVGDVIYCENIKVIGCLTSTVRVGSYYCRNINIDKIHLIATNPIYVNQTAEGGQKGNHFTSGTENLNIGEQLIEGTSALKYALGIDIYAGDTINMPKNFTFGKVTIKDCTTAGISITKVQGMTIGELSIDGYDKYNNNISDCDNIRIGNIYINGASNILTNLYGLYANNVRNLTINEIVSEYNKFIGMYILNCTNPIIDKITANNNGNRGVYFYNNTRAYTGIINSHDNGTEGVYLKSPMTGKLILSYNNLTGNGVIFDTLANGCHDCKFEKIIAYNNKDVNIGIFGTSINIGEITSYNPIGTGYALWFNNSILNKVDYIEVYGALQGLRYLGNTNIFIRFAYIHNNTTGIALGGTNNGTYIDRVKYLTNTTDITGGTIPATVITT